MSKDKIDKQEDSDALQKSKEDSLKKKVPDEVNFYPQRERERQTSLQVVREDDTTK